MNFSKSHRWTRRQALWMMTGAIAGASVHACAKPPEAPSAQSSSSSTASGGAAGGVVAASIGITTWIGNTPLYIAQEKGFFKDLGLDLKIKVFDTVAQAFPAFTSGQLDGLAPVTSEAVTLASKGVDFKIVTVEDTSVGADVILARNSIKSIKDFKGKKVAVELGGIGHFFLLQILAEAGLTGKDVTLVNTPPDAAAAAFQAGKVEIAYSYSPFSDKAIAAQKDGRVIYSSKQMPTAIADLYLFSSKFIQANPKTVAAFVEGNLKGVEFLATNRKEGLEIGAAKLKIKPEELDQQLKGIRIPDKATNIAMLGDASSDQYLLKPMTKLAAFLKDQGQIQTVPDLSKVLEPQYVTALK
ncbi:ABC transporter substrate-binding protein [Stenomitos frigidus]|uniref:Myristoyl transferase n=1 Tax=Stenomitos frigidus ULC18 TaxID=2107698 RepID=A0A2T1ECP0_9CYAN|nr:ABC transporter substrate-binding protein [Stenomitos frigidus]PSB30453.1 myristoyl transferase [Stenomitos frigidus ULC18]